MAVMSRAALYKRLDSMRRKHHIKGVFDPYAFLRQTGIQLAEHCFSDTEIQGILVRSGGSRGIITNSRLTPAVRRFVITHELVHLELHRGEVRGTLFKERDIDEYQADEGAAELLLPYRDFIPRVADMRRRFLRDPVTATTVLANFYQLDCEHIRKRIKSLDYELGQYRLGVPLEEITPLSSYHKREKLSSSRHFLRITAPISIQGIDIYKEAMS